MDPIIQSRGTNPPTENDTYYYFTGLAAKIESLSFTTTKLANKWFKKSEVLSGCDKLANLAVANALTCISTPLNGVMWLISKIFQEKINPETYENEKRAWDKIVEGPNKDLCISQLIRAKLLPENYEKVEVKKEAKTISYNFEKIQVVGEPQECCSIVLKSSGLDNPVHREQLMELLSEKNTFELLNEKVCSLE